MAKDHPSVEHLYKRVKPEIPPIFFDTVYRSLALFERNGVITRMRHLDDRNRYDPKTSKQHHLFWIKYRKIREFSYSALEGMDISEETKGWGEIRSKYLWLRGICQECLEREKKESRDQRPGLHIFSYRVGINLKKE